MDRKQTLIGIDMANPLSSSVTAINGLPILKETMTVQSYGRLHEVDKEQVMKEFKCVHLGVWVK
ncbi:MULTISPECIES: hypothetical protein [Bacillus]|uniref:hypothetical protein n=1 Tax=Bacillus TaxID=1386 RepID=UPI0008FDBB78|nr:hypothetical protein [Bacillus sp. NH11B]OJD64433.1 hypothetical protein BAU27_05465 [Bacillus sp. NH11B]